MASVYKKVALDIDKAPTRPGVVPRTRPRLRWRVSYATVRASHPHPRRTPRECTPDPRSSSRLTESGDLEVELGAAPVAALGVVPGGSGGRNADGQREIDGEGGVGNPKKSTIFPHGACGGGVVESGGERT